MAKVFSGKVLIPGDGMEEYIKMLQAAERERAPFRDYLMNLATEFHDDLLDRFTEHTANKHASIIVLFVDFICRYTDVQDISEITRGMVNSHFQSWWRRKVLGPGKPEDLRRALKKFFAFLAVEKGIVNEKVRQALG
ncbi:MAG: hypothetical protein JXQ27_13815 [Acidobacteria bacterium]|nr:hypothetical protein [Acidobacteriota bacterium]